MTGVQTCALPILVAETLLLFETHAVKAGIGVDRRLTPDLPWVEADANQLQQVLLNLLNNAREALGGRGEIRVSTALTADGRVRFSVTDDGPGIPPEIQPRIFVPFFTTKEEGTGLGLSVSYRIVRDHGGRLEVTSEPGAGAAFTVDLPAAPAAR